MNHPIQPQVIQSRKKRIWSKIGAIAVIILLAAVFKYLLGGSEPPETLTFSGNTMATIYQVKVVDRQFDEDRKKLLAVAIKNKLELVNTQMSRYHEGGDIFRLNEAGANVPVRLSAEVIDVLKKANQISRQTNGAFDVTVGPLIRLWGFHDKKPLQQLPSESQLQETRKRVGYHHLHINSKEGTVTKDVEGVDVDLSAIAKGRAVDMVAEALDAAGERNYMVEVGGEIRCKGKNAKGMTWKIGIEKPVGGDMERRQVSLVVSLDNISLATSGDYRSFYMLEGKRISHTINPATGKPIQHTLASVSVLASDCMTADALATALTVFGAGAGKKFADKHNTAAYFIERTDDSFIGKASVAFTKLNEESKGN